ncbi:Nif3-like dinuclear metal center hexameric protein [Xylanibacter muris]|uniref:Nif3-like dinuclear metal center hexameric protein n=1 Tax=Xylanibacter muris TaxID=2736290 RepID=A0ABX2AMJ6_9BACT|nr:Nif3-like dinuclear metal center hexameric protein [Xylanibacter muris]NPD92419.1 Nif3-like dinuclear metal center hexameric protein [Xylanibacter muris]
MKIKEVVSALERFAPLPLQEDWDNAGLQIGLTEAEASGALLCLDVTESIVDEAIARHCNLIVSHHPLLFRGLKVISDADYVQRTVMKAIRNDICIVSMHTNMDNARGGVNFMIAEKLGLADVGFLSCGSAADSGSGVTGMFAEGMGAEDFTSLVKGVFNVECLQCNELLHRKIRKVAVCGGAGDFLLGKAVEAGADAFITGEMHYHVYFGYEQKIQICVTGHYQSEQFTNEIFKSIITEECPGLPVVMAETNTNPIIYV